MHGQADVKIKLNLIYSYAAKPWIKHLNVAARGSKREYFLIAVLVESYFRRIFNSRTKQTNKKRLIFWFRWMFMCFPLFPARIHMQTNADCRPTLIG